MTSFHSNTSATNVVEMESLLDMTAAPFQSSVLPRWQRKSSSASNKTSKTPVLRKQKSLKAKSSTPHKLHSTVNSSKSQSCHDRFIPNRSGMDFDLSHYSFTNKQHDEKEQDSYRSNLASKMLGTSSESTSRVLSFKNKAPVPETDSFENQLKVLYTHNKSAKTTVMKPTRHIPSAPIRILDAPELMDNYYLNLLSWGQNNVLAVALGSAVYLWDASTGSIDELMTCDDNMYISSVSWIQQGSAHIAIGTSDGAVQLYDADTKKRVRNMTGHQARVGALSWNNHVISSGSKDGSIIHHDVRIRDHKLATLIGHHDQEVCGLSWSPDGTILASGGNDNILNLWDSSTMNRASTPYSPTFSMNQHNAAVKALAWCPWERNLLASGGGTADRTIKFWNSSNGALLNSIDTGSQVCSLLWSKHEKEILSSHGYAQNQLCLWKYPTMTKVKELNGHSARVLHLASSPDDSMVVSAAGDETLRFWNVFSPPKTSKKVSDIPASSFTNLMGISANAITVPPNIFTGFFQNHQLFES